MQEIAPGGFQIMWKPSAVPSTANPATSWNMFRKTSLHCRDAATDCFVTH